MKVIFTFNCYIEGFLIVHDSELAWMDSSRGELYLNIKCSNY